MNQDKKMNVLVIGSSGVGKTTLIKSIAGIEIEEGCTQKIDVYESSEWPFCFIDTKGFEYNLFEQWKTIFQIKKYTKKKSETESNEIDAVWYCIEGTSRRTFDYNIRLMSKAIKGWKNVPVFVVLTKSYSEADIPKNVEEIESVFANYPNIQLKKIVPVVAQEYIVDEETTVAPRGIEELCLATLDCMDESLQISKENRNRLIMNQKRFTAHSAVVTASGIGAGIAFTDRLSIADSALLVPLEVGMTKLIFKIYGVKFSNDLVDSVVGGTAITATAKFIIGKLDRTQIIDAAVAGTIVFVLGEAVIAACEASEKGTLKLDEIQEFVSKKIQEAPVIKKMVTFLNENVEKLNKYSIDELIAELKKIFKKSGNGK